MVIQMKLAKFGDLLVVLNNKNVKKLSRFKQSIKKEFTTILQKIAQ